MSRAGDFVSGSPYSLVWMSRGLGVVVVGAVRVGFEVFFVVLGMVRLGYRVLVMGYRG